LLFRRQVAKRIFPDRSGFFRMVIGHGLKSGAASVFLLYPAWPDVTLTVWAHRVLDQGAVRKV
jgi:hypothetical protein